MWEIIHNVLLCIAYILYLLVCIVWGILQGTYFVLSNIPILGGGVIWLVDQGWIFLQWMGQELAAFYRFAESFILLSALIIVIPILFWRQL